MGSYEKAQYFNRYTLCIANCCQFFDAVLLGKKTGATGHKKPRLRVDFSIPRLTPWPQAPQPIQGPMVDPGDQNDKGSIVLALSDATTNMIAIKPCKFYFCAKPYLGLGRHLGTKTAL
jgi:hypothetical protein